jgi:adenosine deaminase
VDNPNTFFQNLPKVEIHRHLEGSLRLRTMMDIARAHGITIPISTGPLSSLVQVQTSEPCNYQNFLAKFNTLRRFYLTPEIIQRVTRETVADAARDNVRHLELRFTPLALSHARQYPLGEVMDWVCESADQAALEFGLSVRLIASVNRHESTRLAEQVARLAAARIENGIVGLDLAGDEAGFSAQPFAGLFKEAAQSGLKLTLHAGEWAGADNVRDALELFHADRIGHGVRVLDDPHSVALARERNTAFEVCVTSNIQTGVVPAVRNHPLLKMLAAGLNVTIGTDNPSISQITLGGEYHLLCEDLGMEHQQLKICILAAARASFLPPLESESLLDKLGKELKN